MKKDLILIGGLAIIIVGLLFFTKSYNLVPGLTPAQVLTKTEVVVGGKIFNVDIARNTSEHAKGLSARDSLAEDSGMLFVFNKADKHQFWMKNTKVALDIIWIDQNKIIVDYYKEAQPEPGVADSKLRIYSPSAVALYVLELPAGTIDKYQLVAGNSVAFELQR